MQRLLPVLILLLAVVVGPPAMAPWPPHPAGRAAAEDFRPLPFHELAEHVHDRYRGRLIGAEVARPSPAERAFGAALVYEFRLLTPDRNLLRIRMDARNGRFLEVAGRGQMQALRRAPGRGHGDDDDDD